MAVEVGQVRAEIVAGMPRAEIRAELDRIAREGADFGRSVAPVYHGPPGPDVEPGKFRDSIHAEEAEDHDGLPAARIISRSRVAHLLEFGTSKMREHATFGKIAAQYGGTVDRVDAEGSVKQGKTIG